MLSQTIKGPVFLLAAVSSSVFAEILNVTFQAKLVQSPCVLDASSKDLTVDFGNIMTADVDAIGINAIIQEKFINLTVNFPKGTSSVDVFFSTTALQDNTTKYIGKRNQ